MSKRNETIKPNMVMYNNKVVKNKLYSANSTEKYRLLPNLIGRLCSQAQDRTGI